MSIVLWEEMFIVRLTEYLHDPPHIILVLILNAWAALESSSLNPPLR